MSSLFHRSRQRRAERASITAHGSINLVPLVDILTSIVFFSLLTYQGAALAPLTSFDLALPPVVVATPEQARVVAPERKTLKLLLSVRVDNDHLRVEHSGDGGFQQQIAGLGPASLDSLQHLMTTIRERYPQNGDVVVIPSDDVSYDNLVHVLDHLKRSGYTGISLATRARATRSTPSTTGGR